MSHTAKAYENCDRSFKPVFADPKPQKDAKLEVFRGNNDTRDIRSDNFGGMYVRLMCVYVCVYII